MVFAPNIKSRRVENSKLKVFVKNALNRNNWKRTNPISVFILISINAKRFISFVHCCCKMELPFDKNKRIFHSRADNPSSFLHLSCLKWGAEHSQLVIERINHSSTFGYKNKRTQTSSSQLLKQKEDSKDLGFVILGAGPWSLLHFNNFFISIRLINLKLTDNLLK